MFEPLSNSQCCGCQACVEVCPKKCLHLCEDNEGFMYPEIVSNSSCVNCNLCNQVCPIKHNNGRSALFSEAYYGYTSDSRDIERSSSGGIFITIARYYQTKGYFICGASFTEDYLVKHVIIPPHENIEKLQGSKYSQSDMTNIYASIEKLLKNSEKVLFSGLPCQVEALKTYLKTEYENLISIDLLCYGVQSPKVWKYYLDEHHQGRNITSINMRSKAFGWKKYSMEIEYADGGKYLNNKNDDPYLLCYSKGLFVRPSCYSCRFKGFPRRSDLTLGDFWEINEMYPKVNSSKGVSIIIPNGENGKKIIQDIRDRIVYEAIDMKRLEEMNIQYLKPCDINPGRKNFFDGIKRNDSFSDLATQFVQGREKKKAIYEIKKFMYRNGIWKMVKPFWNFLKKITTNH